ncbi:hypothetical protein A3C87_03255 [Candidatus Kaiserbacteria bacterium RIFCSPHIGHO2_02_FULL_49_34]|uniref:Second mannosyl transferase n=1 Tax=Candidatus Kaiserbacteria bacterium RIFCSPHIGHO2_02_FULL_49_34 TaxID=1798491 RepID=A0A1F6DIA2_9BACT|nr:MAG: hypothetical protein A3C87_03255 [Candidatus Kaiserbacteria bacterium RIFCSPHIGHO2_02_FULL_49_34]
MIHGTTSTKILYLITKSNWGGAQRYVYDLATGAQHAGFSVAVALGGEGELVERLSDAGVTVRTLRSLTRDVGFLQEIRAFQEILRILKKEKPDVLHINSSKAGIMGALAGRLCNVPRIIFTAHGWAFNEKRPFWQKGILKFFHWLTVMLAHTTIAVADVTKRQLNWPFTARKMTLVYNGLEEAGHLSKNDARTQLAIQYHELSPYLHDLWSVSIGELHPTKQHDVMIRAMRDIVEAQPHVRHIIMGEGEARKNLEHLIHKYGLEKNVFLLGNVPNASKYLTAFSFVVLPSRTEAFPYVLLEACAAGVPVIASSVGGVPEIIRHREEGLLVSSGDASALADACLLLHTNEKLRTHYAHNARMRSGIFTKEKMLQKTFALYL